MRIAPVLALLLLAAVAAPAGAMIVPQDNIAGVKIGMTQEQVLAVLGDDLDTRTRLGGGGGDTPITTYTYHHRGMKVLFKPNSANTANIAFSVQVYKGNQQRTSKGVGIGSKRATVLRLVPGAKCRRYDPTYAFCLVGSGKVGRVSTTFLLDRRNEVKLVFISKPFDD